MYLVIWLLIGLLGNQGSMCRNLSLLVLFSLSPCFGYFLFLLGFGVVFGGVCGGFPHSCAGGGGGGGPIWQRQARPVEPDQVVWSSQTIWV